MLDSLSLCLIQLVTMPLFVCCSVQMADAIIFVCCSVHHFCIGTSVHFTSVHHFMHQYISAFYISTSFLFAAQYKWLMPSFLFAAQYIIFASVHFTSVHFTSVHHFCLLLSTSFLHPYISTFYISTSFLHQYISTFYISTSFLFAAQYKWLMRHRMSGHGEHMYKWTANARKPADATPDTPQVRR